MGLIKNSNDEEDYSGMFKSKNINKVVPTTNSREQTQLSIREKDDDSDERISDSEDNDSMANGNASNNDSEDQANKTRGRAQTSAIKGP